MRHGPFVRWRIQVAKVPAVADLLSRFPWCWPERVREKRSWSWSSQVKPAALSRTRCGSPPRTETAYVAKLGIQQHGISDLSPVRGEDRIVFQARVACDPSGFAVGNDLDVDLIGGH